MDKEDQWLIKDIISERKKSRYLYLPQVTVNVADEQDVEFPL